MKTMKTNDIIDVLIVDDEPDVRTVLKSALSSISYINIVGEADNVPEAVRKIHKHKPRLIFLDIEMPDYSGLQLVEFFNAYEINFEIIFVTAYDEYALEAFRVSAFDYLLKPINQSELISSLEQYRKKRINHKLAERISQFKKSYESDEPIDKIAVSTSEGIAFLDISEIVLLEASNVYTTVIGSDGVKTVASKPLGEFETMLKNNPSFYRPHRSFLINLKYIDKLDTTEGDIIYMQNKIQVPLSRYKKKEFMESVKKYIV